MNRQIKFRAWDGERMRDMFAVSSYGEILMGGEEYPSWQVMQYTGLKDKNGVEIYEGDIIEVNMGWSKGGHNSMGYYEPAEEIKYLREVAWVETGLNWKGSVSGSTLCFGNCKIL